MVVTLRRLAMLSMLLSACGLGPLTSEEVFRLSPVPLAWVVGSTYDARTGAPLAGVVLGNATSDARGAYRLEHVAVGAWSGVALKEGYAPRQLEAAIRAGANQIDFALTPLGCGGCGADQVCDIVTQQCVATAILSSDVVSACTGAAIAARVTVNAHSLCSANRKGYFELRDLSPGGPQTLAVGKGGYEVFSTKITLVSGFNTLDSIRLLPLGGCTAPPPADEPCVCEDVGCQR